jgi:hypothetical protein
MEDFIKIEDLIIGKTYWLKGIIENGWFTDENCKTQIRYSPEDVVRPIKRITDDFVIAACDRKFLRKGLQVEKVAYETYD